jgi:hypothetical protein
MNSTYNIYCDESCHLESDQHNVMVLGAIWCPLQATRQIAKDIRQIKARHGLANTFEMKWTKVSPAKVNFYQDVVNYFFRNEDLCFRALVVPDKSKLRHKDFEQTHDQWYYKMYFNLVKVVLETNCKYRIYLDIKDTHCAAKAEKLQDVLCNSLCDFDKKIIERVQPVHSSEVEQIQLADLLTGAVSYINRKQTKSTAKLAVANDVNQLSGHRLMHGTIREEKKCNIFIWRPKEENNE